MQIGVPPSRLYRIWGYSRSFYFTYTLSVTYYRRNSLKQSFAKINIRDGVVGYFGWLVFSNLAFFLLLSFYFGSRSSSVRIDGTIISYIISFSTLIAILVAFLKKRIWTSIGIVLAVIANLALWVAFLQVAISSDFTEMIMFMGIPLPLGFVIGIIH